MSESPPIRLDEPRQVTGSTPELENCSAPLHELLQALPSSREPKRAVWPAAAEVLHSSCTAVQTLAGHSHVLYEAIAALAQLQVALSQTDSSRRPALSARTLSRTPYSSRDCAKYCYLTSDLPCNSR